jgi:hypothetical protein
MVVASLILICGAHLGLRRDLGGDPLIQLIIGLFEDDGQALLISVGQGGTLQLGEAQVIKLVSLPVDAEDYVPETFAGALLAVEHGHQMRPIGELSRIRPLPGMAVHQVIENMSRMSCSN